MTMRVSRFPHCMFRIVALQSPRLVSIAKFSRKLLKSGYIMAFELRKKILDRNLDQSSCSEDSHVALNMG